MNEREELELRLSELRSAVREYGYHEFSATTVRMLVFRETDKMLNSATIADVLHSIPRVVHEIAAQAAELERLRERCEAAERFRFGSLLFSCSNNGWECYRLSDGNYLGDPPHSNTFIYKTFDEAYQAAIDAGWLPDSKNKGGE